MIRLGRDGPQLRVTTAGAVVTLVVALLGAFATARGRYGEANDLYPASIHLVAPSAGWVVLGGVAIALVVLVSSLLHELGHVLGARLAGVRLEAIELNGFGGLASWEDRDDLTGGRLAVLALGGPAVTAVLTLAFGLADLATGGGPTSAGGLVLDRVVTTGFVVNAVALVANFLPIPPLDGALLQRAVRLARG